MVASFALGMLLLPQHFNSVTFSNDLLAIITKRFVLAIWQQNCHLYLFPPPLPLNLKTELHTSINYSVCVFPHSILVISQKIYFISTDLQP
jgi:hypothetical protein